MKLSKEYFFHFFQGILDGAWKAVNREIKLPLTVFFRDRIFLLDDRTSVSEFFSEFQSLSQSTASWNLKTRILGITDEGNNMECYSVDVRLSGEGSFRNSKMSAKFYVKNIGNTPRIEVIEFL